MKALIYMYELIIIIVLSTNNDRDCYKPVDLNLMKCKLVIKGMPKINQQFLEVLISCLVLVF